MAKVKKKAEEPPKKEGARSFAVFVADCADGELLSEASQELHDLVSKLGEMADEYHCKAKGKFTLTFDLSVDQKGVMGIDYDVKAKATTKYKRATAQAWATDGGNVSFINPRQLTFGIHEVRGGRDEDDAEDLGDDGRQEASEV